LVLRRSTASLAGLGWQASQLIPNLVEPQGLLLTTASCIGQRPLKSGHERDFGHSKMLMMTMSDCRALMSQAVGVKRVTT
jgi:hypothetical protein